MVAKKIYKALFDVRPTTGSGDLDVARIKQIQPVLDLSNIVFKEKEYYEADDSFLFADKQLDIEVAEKADQKAYSINVENENKIIADKVSRDSNAFTVEKSVLQERDATNQSLLEENIPSREDLLSEILAIDKEDEALYLKHKIERSQQFTGNTVCLRPECFSSEHQQDDLSLQTDAEKEVYSAEKKEDQIDLLEKISDQNLENKFDQPTIDKIKSFRDQIEKIQGGKDEPYFSPAAVKPAIKNIAQNDSEEENLIFPDELESNPHRQITREEDVLLGSASLVQLPREWKKSLAIFAVCAMLVSFAVPALAFFQKGLQKKDKVMELSQEAYVSLNMAKQSAEDIDLQGASASFDDAYKKFAAANYEISGLNKFVLDIIGKIPGISVVKSGEHLLQVGQNISSAGKLIVEGIMPFLHIEDDYWKNFTGSESDLYFPENSLTKAIFESNTKLALALDKLDKVEYDLLQVDVSDLPEEVRESILSLKEKVPFIKNGLSEFLAYSDVILEILGNDSPKKYLILFQNPDEMRATGGFIGTYGVLDMNSGYVNKVFVDGIYNPDGQMHTLVEPPAPIQKISANWSLHDSNWFADYPTSARKAAWFYEKTGGPTVDGVFAVTPFIIKKMLEITGPIEMSEYGVVVDSENFIEQTQYEVEFDYDKELNKPKQFIADLAPKLFNKILNSEQKDWKKIIDVIKDSLQEKHILLYFFDEDVQRFVSDKNWDGRVLESAKDYLSVINSNINGYKTDGVVEETISHNAEILEDGSVIDTVTIYRKNEGGGKEYDWWNKVNSDYMRVFVPLGSVLLDAKGHTKESEYEPSVDYSSYLSDKDVADLENSMKIDEKTGTRIFEESGKTVFANWVYVSPGEDVSVSYKYKLPFKIDISKGLDKYSLIVQKQSGSEGSMFSHKLNISGNLSSVYEYPENGENETALTEDRFFGAVLERVR